MAGVAPSCWRTAGFSWASMSMSWSCSCGIRDFSALACSCGVACARHRAPLEPFSTGLLHPRGASISEKHRM